ncbi:hypothetical protein ACLOJK_017147 [Asimina triloba]
MGSKDEIAPPECDDFSPEFGIVEDADRLHSMGAIDSSIEGTFVYGNEKQTATNHFHERLSKLKDLMKTQAAKEGLKGGTSSCRNT